MESHLKKALVWGVELGVEIAKDLEDKKFTLAEGIALWDNALKIPGVVKSIPKIPAEWNQNKDNAEYMNTIVQAIQQKLVGVGTETAQELALQAIKCGIEIGKLVDLSVQAHKERK